MPSWMDSLVIFMYIFLLYYTIFPKHYCLPSYQQNANRAIKSNEISSKNVPSLYISSTINLIRGPVQKKLHFQRICPLRPFNFLKFIIHIIFFQETGIFSAPKKTSIFIEDKDFAPPTLADISTKYNKDKGQ